jgi:hypothetical protein
MSWLVVNYISWFFHAAGFEPGFAGHGGWGADHPTPNTWLETNPRPQH